MKRAGWHQNNPADQMVAVIMAIRGLASNLVDGIYQSDDDLRRVATKIDTYGEELCDLVKLLPPTKWPEE